MTSFIRSLALPAVAAALFAAVDAPAVKAAEVSILMDEARLVTLSRPAKTVFTGNAMIADATIVDPNHVFVSGRNFGSTNLVALDAEGHEISNTPVTVLERAGVRVTLTRAADRRTFGCASGRCEATPTPGDDYPWYRDMHSEIDLRLATSLKSAEQ
ncbi:MAG TPA: pilus assembly protein N-terminal domain-containing protein [Micropepsaceae bacterium]|nr:pilus assembly protein N-terminal domain-containing protein [Micropepsaceae bacterium]